MKTAEIRRRFLDFFATRGHEVVPSAPLLYNDPTLLFVNAGMVPFKPYFTGAETAPYDRATSVQKCVRTLDIEEVGKTTRHGTFFQMNGNFSFGDYFKAEAIRYAWELVTGSQDDGGYGFDPSKVWVTVLHSDDEAAALWESIAGLPAKRIQRRGLLDNYWHMGIPGPGGPCSEIYIDRGPQYGPDGGPIVDEDRFLEIWNLVFMQEELAAVRKKDDFDIARPLPRKNIDTGMGLERVAYLLQDVDNLYEIDQVYPVLEHAAQLSGKRYGDDHGDDVRMRVVADHVRSGLMLIADGVTPGNEARGYVLRRLLRRVIRSMRLLGVAEPVLPELLPVSRDLMSESYPEVESDWARISQIAYGEEDAFRRTLTTGTQIFDLAVADAKQRHQPTLTGERAFQLHDTYGFPIDLTLEMASEQGLSVDEPGFRRLMQEQKDRAKADAKSKKAGAQAVEVYRDLRALGATPFTGYTELTTESKVRGIVVDGELVEAAEEGDTVEVVLERTPFYAESGGQDSDAGRITGAGVELEVVDVQRPVKGLIVHRVRVTKGELLRGTDVLAAVDGEWRLGACQAHSGTHVMHAALRQILGPTALQSGSYNKPGYLRLDFAWQSGLSQRVRADVEEAANQAIRKDLNVSRELHAAGHRAGDRRARAVRRDVRRGGARRRDGRPLVARALRWHPRAALVADRSGHHHRRAVGGVGRTPGRGLRRHRGLPLPGQGTRAGARPDRDAEGAAGPADRSGQQAGRAAQGRGEADRRPQEPERAGRCRQHRGHQPRHVGGRLHRPPRRRGRRQRPALASRWRSATGSPTARR